MICRLHGHILNKTARQTLLTAPDSSKSWFVKLRSLCDQYNLPTPLNLILNPLPKDQYKSLVRSHIVNYWETQLRYEVSLLSSLSFFKSEFMSLCRPHFTWTTCGSNPFEANKAVVMASMLSGRYKTDYLAHHWDSSNPEGFCLDCLLNPSKGDITHLLLFCDALSRKRTEIIKYWYMKSQSNRELRNLLKLKLKAPISVFAAFLLDPSADPDMIMGHQLNQYTLQELFQLCRTWCYAMHRQRLQLRGRYKQLDMHLR